MPHFTAEHITRTIFDETVPPSMLRTLASKAMGTEAANRPIPLKTALKQLKKQGLDPRAQQKVEQTLHKFLSERLHNILQDLAIDKARKIDTGMGVGITNNSIRWADNYYLGAGIFTPRVDLSQETKIINALRDGFKEELYQTMTVAYFLFKKPARKIEQPRLYA